MNNINLSPYDYVGIDNRGLVAVNGLKYYNPKYYNIISANPTQQAVINRLNPIKHSKNQLKQELKNVNTIRLLANKVTTYDNYTEKIKSVFGDEDKKYLLIKRQDKAKQVISKYLKTLKQDKHFVIEQLDKLTYRLHYKGVYATFTKQVNLNNKVGCL